MPASFVPTPVMTTPDGKLDPTVEVTVLQAAALCAVRTDTITRRLHAGLLPGKRRRPGDPHGRWIIPIGDLATAGLLDRCMLGDPDAPARAAVAEADVIALARLRGENAGLRGENAGLREAFEARGATIEAQAHAIEVYRKVLDENGTVA